MTGKSAHPEIIDSAFLLNAYRHGFFPMADPEDGEIHWYSPDPRGIIELEECTPSRSLRQTLKKGIFNVKVNARFEEVIRFCAEREETWISEEIIMSYVRLHEMGCAHSVETWHEGKLAGGLYGVSIGGAFFGESMVSLTRDASKVALIHLADRLREQGYVLLDTQYMTPHLKNFGGAEIPRSEYLKRLKHAVTLNCSFT